MRRHPQTMPDVSVSIAAAAELEDLASLFDGYRVFYQQPSDPDRARTFLRERFQHNDSVIFIARRDGVAAGFVQMYPSFSSVSTARVWILNDLFVAPHARRNGVARALMDFAVEWAAADGAARLILETARENVPAKALYRELGWMMDEEFDRFSLEIPTR